MTAAVRKQVNLRFFHTFIPPEQDYFSYNYNTKETIFQ